MERAITVGLELDEDISSKMEELNELVNAAGAEVVKTIVQRKVKVDSRTFFGKGKVEEIAQWVEAEEIDMLVVNHELTGSQLRNLEELIECKIVDRTNLILDIFALRAQTLEGKLQVKLAQLQYRMPRIIGYSDYLSRTGGGIGTRGPGEQKLETDRRHIQREIYNIKNQLKTVSKQRDTKRKRRINQDIPIISFVGYTNAGKSTLMNRLMISDDHVFEKDMLFATLDTTLRQGLLPSGQPVLFADTVGFVSDLPTALIEAFKGTLEEIKYSDLIIHVVDASHEDLNLQMQITYDILKDMDVLDKELITIYNKMDKVKGDTILEKHIGFEETYYMSALNEDDCHYLLQIIEGKLQKDYEAVQFKIPFAQHAIYNEILNDYGVEDETTDEESTILTVKMKKEDINKYKDYIMR